MGVQRSAFFPLAAHYCLLPLRYLPLVSPHGVGLSVPLDGGECASAGAKGSGGRAPELQGKKPVGRHGDRPSGC
mgnify:CR=1 FL=1